MIAPALILAAGKGTRMGTPKALMQSGSVPWWHIQQGRLARANVPAFWIISPQVREGMSEPPADSITADPNAPMFASILAGLRAAHPTQGIFILPVDVPAATDSRIWAALASSPSPITPTHQGKHGHPIFLPQSWLDAVLFPAVRAATDPTSLRLDTLIRPQLAELPVNDPVVACNLNTPDDLHRFLASPSGSDPRTA